MISPSQNQASLFLASLHISERLRRPSRLKEATKILRSDYEVVCPLLGKSHQLTQQLDDSQNRTILRRVLANRKPVTSKASRSALKTRSTQKTRQIYMQDIARTAIFVKPKPKGSSRMDEVRRAIKHKVDRIRMSRPTTKLTESPSKRLIRPSLTQSPPRCWPVQSDIVTPKLTLIEAKFAKVNKCLQLFKHQNLQLKELVGSRSSLGSDLSV